MRNWQMSFPIITLVLTSCIGPLPPATERPLITATSVFISTPSPSFPHPMATDITAIPTEAHLKIQCLDVAPGLPTEANVSGVVALTSRFGFEPSSLVNLETRVKGALPQKPNDVLRNFAISPDGQLMAYEQATFEKHQLGSKIIADKLIIASRDGQKKKVIMWEEDWISVSRWLDNARLLIGLLGNGQAPRTLLVLNPFTGERQRLLPDFPDIYSDYPLPEWENSGETIYDPTLRYMVYPQNVPSGDHYLYTLWNLETQKPLALLPTLDFISKVPRWSPSGEKFVVAAPVEGIRSGVDELFSISRDGQITQLTHLTTYYSGAMEIQYRWSPDEHYLAFWFMNTDKPFAYPPSEQNLMILNMVTGEVTNYCIQGDYGGPYGTVPFIELPIIWSPDSQQLIVENRYAQDASHVILVDIVHGYATQIAENMMPVGWMN